MASIHKRPRKNGTVAYQLAWRDPDTGVERWTFDTDDEAQKWQRLLDANGQSLAAAKLIDSKMNSSAPTLATVFQTHLRQLTDVSEYQIGRYETAIRDHFNDLGKRPIDTITRADISEWINTMKKKPGRKPGSTMAAKTIANHHGLLSATMQTAVNEDLIPSNPCKGVRLPKAAHTDEVIRFITHDEWARIKAHTKPRFLPFLELLVGTGLRFSEATALQASDFTLTGKTPSVRVTKAWKARKGGGYYIGPPKTPKSRRTVTLAPSTVNAVRPLVEAAGDGYVFTMQEGGVIRSGAFYNRGWEPALLGAGFRKDVIEDGEIVTPGDMPRVHDIRHTHASWMIGAGMEIFALSRRLGHESITTSLDRYSHLLPDAQFKAIMLAQKAIEPGEFAGADADDD